MAEPVLLVFDFDGCLYPSHKDYKEIYAKAVAQVSQYLSGGQWDLETAGRNAWKSLHETGFAFKGACDQFGRSMKEGHMAHHQTVHLPLVPDHQLIQSLKDLSSDTYLMILTHGSRCFLDRKLPMLGIDRFFDRNMRVTHDQYDFVPKSKGMQGFVMASVYARTVTGLDFRPENIWMFEDTHANLRIPKEMGWNTVLVHHGDPAIYQNAEEPYIDHCSATAGTALVELGHSKAPMPDHNSSFGAPNCN